MRAREKTPYACNTHRNVNAKREILNHEYKHRNSNMSEITKNANELSLLSKHEIDEKDKKSSLPQEPSREQDLHSVSAEICADPKNWTQN